MKVSTENDNNFGYEKITIVVDNIPLRLYIVIYINKMIKQNTNKFQNGFKIQFKIDTLIDI